MITIAKPLKTAPATKYGGKIVACQPGSWAVAKSKLTTECTESTSGVARAAQQDVRLLIAVPVAGRAASSPRARRP